MGTAGDIREFWMACAREGRYLFFAVALPYFLVSFFFRRKQTGTDRGAITGWDPGSLARAYIENMRHLDALCRSRGIRFATALQPYNGVGERPLTEADRVIVSAAKKAPAPGGGSRLDFTATYYAKLRGLGKEEPFFADLTSVFDHEEGQVFFDNVHFSDRGQRAVGEALARLVMEKDGETP